MTERDFKGIWIPKEIWLRENLTLQEKVFLVEIDSLDNKDGCFASNEYFSKFFHLSKGRVSVIINSLVKKGFLSAEITYKQNKEIDKRVLKSNIGVCLKPTIPTLENEDRGILGNDKDNNTLLNNTINKDYMCLFDEFWKAYPKKKAKPDALKAWKKIKATEELLDKMLLAIKKQKLSLDWQKENGQYIPHPATWLNGQRWEDEVSLSNGFNQSKAVGSGFKILGGD